MKNTLILKRQGRRKARDGRITIPLFALTSRLNTRTWKSVCRTNLGVPSCFRLYGGNTQHRRSSAFILRYTKIAQKGSGPAPHSGIIARTATTSAYSVVQ